MLGTNNILEFPDVVHYWHVYTSLSSDDSCFPVLRVTLKRGEGQKTSCAWKKKSQITKEFFKKKKTTAARIRTRGKVHRKMQVARGIWSGALVFTNSTEWYLCKF